MRFSHGWPVGYRSGERPACTGDRVRKALKALDRLVRKRTLTRLERQ